MLVLSLIACVDVFEPEVGDLNESPCLDEDSNPEQAVSFRNDVIDGIFFREGIGCDRCHTPQGETPLGISESALDMTTYGSLLNGGENSGAAVVIPGQPCQSVLYRKLTSSPPFGARMPLAGPPFLTSDELQVVADWIAEGARDN